MDAFAVALAAGVVLRPLCFRPCFRLAFHFGLFQALMPVIGWLAGLTVQGFVAAWSHWIAFCLLVWVGGHMIREALAGEEGGARPTDPSRGMTMVALSVATSIDALAVGLSLAMAAGPGHRPGRLRLHRGRPAHRRPQRRPLGAAGRGGGRRHSHRHRPENPSLGPVFRPGRGRSRRLIPPAVNPRFNPFSKHKITLQTGCFYVSVTFFPQGTSAAAGGQGGQAGAPVRTRRLGTEP
jgi:hypothetical protein